MYMGDIEAAVPAVEAGPAEPHGSIVLGAAFAAVAIPYWIARLVGGILWRDLRRAGRILSVAGGIYAEALRGR